VSECLVRDGASLSPIRLAIEEAQPLWSTPNRSRSTAQTSRPSH